MNEFFDLALIVFFNFSSLAAIATAVSAHALLLTLGMLVEQPRLFSKHLQ